MVLLGNNSYYEVIEVRSPDGFILATDYYLDLIVYILVGRDTRSLFIGAFCCSDEMKGFCDIAISVFVARVLGLTGLILVAVIVG